MTAAKLIEVSVYTLEGGSHYLHVALHDATYHVLRYQGLFAGYNVVAAGNVTQYGIRHHCILTDDPITTHYLNMFWGRIRPPTEDELLYPLHYNVYVASWLPDVELFWEV